MRRGRILILLGLILAIGTAAIVFIMLQGTAGGKGTVEVEREEVVVAIQPIPEDEPVEGRVEIRAMPKESIPVNALRSLEEAKGMLAAGPIPQGTILQPDLLTSPAELMEQGKLEKLIEPGFVAVAFPIDELSSVSYGIQPGDHVDVLMSFWFIDIDLDTQSKSPICPPMCQAGEEQAQAVVEQRPRLAAQLTLQDATVLGVGRWSTQPAVQETAATPEPREGEQAAVELPEYITLMLTPQDALVLKFARESGARIDLAVRAQDDHQQFTTQQVTLDYILARFGVSLPAKQPYTIEGIRSVLPTGPEE
ncbi:MAG: Flp pilus assembly protein CpaB [Anaerolineae bacterium]